MKRILFIVLIYTFYVLGSSSQETVKPFEKNVIGQTVQEFVDSNDVFSMDGKIVNLKVRTALAQIVSDDMMLHNMLYPLEYASDFVLFFYPIWQVSQDNKAEITNKVAMFLPNNNNCFEDKDDFRRFYQVYDYDGNPLKSNSSETLMEKWIKASGIHSQFDVEPTEQWLWFNEVAKFKISVSIDDYGEKVAFLTRIMPKYFFIDKGKSD